MHGSVGRLGSDELVERIPGNTLYVMAVLGNLPYHCTCLGVVYAGNVVHAACDEELAVGRPGQVVDFRAHRPAHVLDPPRLLVFRAVIAQLLHGRGFGGNPE